MQVSAGERTLSSDRKPGADPERMARSRLLALIFPAVPLSAMGLPPVIQAIDAIRYAYTFLPALALIGAAAVMCNFPLDIIRQQKLRTELEARDRPRGILE